MERTVEVLTLRGGVYVPHGLFTPRAEVTSPVLPGLRLPVDAVFE